MLAIGALLGAGNGLPRRANGLHPRCADLCRGGVVRGASPWRVTAVQRGPARARYATGCWRLSRGCAIRGGQPVLLILRWSRRGSLVWGGINVLEIPLAEQAFPLNGNGTLAGVDLRGGRHRHGLWPHHCARLARRQLRQPAQGHHHRLCRHDDRHLRLPLRRRWVGSWRRPRYAASARA